MGDLFGSLQPGVNKIEDARDVLIDSLDDCRTDSVARMEERIATQSVENDRTERVLEHLFVRILLW